MRRSSGLYRSISTTLVAFSLAVVVAFAALASMVLYSSYELDAEKSLESQTESVAAAMPAGSQDAEAFLKTQVAGVIRYTYIAVDGTVLYDSSTDEPLENHAGRPEVQSAQASGEAVSSRYSQTLKTDLLYAAIRLDDGSTLRLSQQRHSLFSFIGGVAVPLAALIVAVVAADLLIARILTRRIMRPINAIDVANPHGSDVYDEVTPLLTHIDDQRECLQEQNRQLADAENMRREFSSNVSHEMKTPLTVISGYAELLMNDMVKPEDRQRIAGLIYDEAQEMRSLIDDVLVVSRLDEPSGMSVAQEVIELHDVARIVVGRLDAFAQDHQVKVSIVGESAMIWGSETLCEQMLYNLVENGVRYNHPGGRVVVTTRIDGCGRPQALVSDDGMGIPKEAQIKVFERFFRVDTSRSKQTGGTGLGLAIVKHAVQNQGGTVEVHSTLGRGTVFELTFPTIADRKAALDHLGQKPDEM